MIADLPAGDRHVPRRVRQTLTDALDARDLDADDRGVVVADLAEHIELLHDDAQPNVVLQTQLADLADLAGAVIHPSGILASVIALMRHLSLSPARAAVALGYDGSVSEDPCPARSGAPSALRRVRRR